MSKVRLLVKGRVQGVFYRHKTREKATSLKLFGWVRNRTDGSVEVEAIGPAEQLKALIEWCKSGPPSARVDSVEVQWLAEEGSEEIREPLFQISQDAGV